MYSVSQLAPCVSTSLFAKPGFSATGSGCSPCVAGSNSAAIRYWSRRLVPVSSRTMNGTSLPSSVVVVATSLGGAAGSYGCSPLLIELPATEIGTPLCVGSVDL